MQDEDLALIYYCAGPDRKGSEESICSYTVLNTILENIGQQCWGNLVCIVKGSRKQRNDYKKVDKRSENS